MSALMTETRAGRTFDPIPSWRPHDAVAVDVVTTIPADTKVIGVPTFSDGAVPQRVAIDRATLEASGFTAGRGETLVLRRADGPTIIEMVSDTDDGWRPTGATGFASRLLSSLACNFRRPATSA